MNKEKKSLGFNLFVDEDMNDLFKVFSLLFDSFIRDPEISGSLKHDKRFIKSKEQMQVFIDAINGPTHELGWCKDPDCAWKKKDKVNK